jgi:hypothetical protein
LEEWSPLDKGFCPEGCEMSQYRHFSDSEIAGLDPTLCQMLDTARGISGVPYILTATTGGVHCANSTHYKGLAVDIGLGHLAEGFDRDTQRWSIMDGLHKAGFKRLEEAPLHVHADIGQPPEYPSPCEWLGLDA